MAQLQLQTVQPNLTALRQALDASDDVSNNIMPFIQSIDKFSNNERSTAFNLLRDTFWTQTSNGYQFTDRFKLLSAQNLSIIIKKIGDSKLEKFLCIDNNKKYLSDYPTNDLLCLLNNHYSDRFANFVFNEFKGFLKAPLSFRIQYFRTVSVKAIIMILKNGGVGKSLSNDELIIVTIKMKKYLTSNRETIDITDNTWLDCQSILPEIIQLIMANCKSLTIDNLQQIVKNDLIHTMEQSKQIINELLLRQKKTNSMLSNVGIGGTVDIQKQMNCDKVIGILSTDNFASFQQPMNHNNNNNNDHKLNALIKMDGPLVIMPIDKKKKDDSPFKTEKDSLNYSVLVQIQDLNPLFTSNRNNNPNKPKGSIFIVLLQQIPNNYEVVLFVSNNSSPQQRKELNLGLNNQNPVCIIPWPLPGIGRAVSFKLHCILRPSQKQTNIISYGIRHLSTNTEQKQQHNINDNDNNNDSNLWMMSGNKMVMCIYSGQPPNRFNNNSNRLPWININVYPKMTFFDMIDAATAQLGLPSPSKSSDNNNNQQQQSQQQQQTIWPSFDQSQQNKINTQQYMVRNQMGHQCPLNQVVIKYLDKMVMNANLFPIFIFTTTSRKQQQQRQQRQQRQQQQQQQQQNPMLNFTTNPSGAGTQTNPFQFGWN